MKSPEPNVVRTIDPVDPLSPARGPAAWYGAELAESHEWIRVLSPEEIAELEKAVAQVRGRGLDIVDVRRDDFPLPRLGPVLREIRNELIDGRGFVLLRGLPVERWPVADVAAAYWGIGCWLGRPVTQNPQGHVLGHVKDIGVDADDVNKRGYQSRADLPFHQDIGADAVGLLCLRPAKAGGLSSLASVWTIHNEMLKRRPDLVEVMTRPFWRDRRGEVPQGKDPWYALPVLNYHAGRLVSVYVRRFIESCQRFPDVPRLTPEQVEAMDLFDALAYDPALKLDMDFRPGDVQLVNNLTLLHTRTEYEDWPEPERKRHLLRLWLSIPDAWPLPPAFHERYGTDPETGRPTGIDMAGVRPVAPLDVA